MKKIYFVLFISFMFISCNMDDSGGTSLETKINDISPSLVASKIAKISASSVEVEEFSIGSADIFAFSYDFSNNHWNTPAYSIGTTNTYSNDEKAILLIDDLRFTKNKVHSVSINDNNLPDDIDIIYFDNVTHSIKVGGVWYGDNNDVTSTGNIRENHYLLSAGGSTSFVFFDVVFINKNILSEKVFYDGDDTSVTAGELEVINKVFNQVRSRDMSFAPIIFIPFDGIHNIDNGSIQIIINTENMIDSIDDNFIYWKNENGMPVDYQITSVK